MMNTIFLCWHFYTFNISPIINSSKNAVHLFWQVAALSFGEMYDQQFVKLYNVFMVQLQVLHDFALTHIAHRFS
jgi:hypothetical protein